MKNRFFKGAPLGGRGIMNQQDIKMGTKMSRKPLRLFAISSKVMGGYFEFQKKIGGPKIGLGAQIVKNTGARI